MVGRFKNQKKSQKSSWGVASQIGMGVVSVKMKSTTKHASYASANGAGGTALDEAIRDGCSDNRRRTLTNMGFRDKMFLIKALRAFSLSKWEPWNA